MDPSKQVLLLVEDDPMMLKLYDRIFKMEGYVVELANGGEEGLQMARTSKPSLIVLDIMMPNLDGFEVLTHLKADPTTAPIPVVVLTNLSTEENIERAMELGAVGYMIKSESDPSDVTKRVKEVLQKIG